MPDWQPEPKYDGTRHNAGFEALDYLAAQWQCDIAKAKCRPVRHGTGERPQGRAAQAADLHEPERPEHCPRRQLYKIPADHIIVLCDDITQEPGHLRIRPHALPAGTTAEKRHCQPGHRPFQRIRIGIGAKPNPQYDLAAWVLGKLPAADRKAMTDRYPDIEEACKLLMDDNLQYAQNKFNH